MVWLIESGHTTAPKYATLLSLAEALGVSIEWLVSGVGPWPTAEQVQTAVEQAQQRFASAGAQGT